jgi:cytochrome c556
MRSKGLLLVGVFVQSCALAAQTPADVFQPVATMKQLMVEILHPASNNILLLVNRGGPGDDKEWAEVRRSAMTLAESANLLIVRNRAAGWVADARLLAEVGTAAYKTAEAMDAKGLAALTERIDASCTTCHKQFRPAVFPPLR